MPLLPQDFDRDTYWRDLYKRPLSFWQPALEAIAKAHELRAAGWRRAALGRNIVFLNSTTVIKMGPPYWPGEMAREAAALRFVTGRLPVATPLFVATGTLDGWEYLVQTWLPGTNLRQGDLWQKLDVEARAALAYQHGALMAAIHSLPLHDAPSILHFDWAEMLAEQHECCAGDLRAGGVDGALVDQVEAYLAATPWQIEQDSLAWLHGDLTHLNFLVVETDGVWQITGLIDWGDVKIGPPSHEFISPAMHMYRGDRAALWQWYQGYPLLDRQRVAEVQHVSMARSMLYYSESFANQIQKTPGAASCTSWSALASLFFQMEPLDCSR